MISIPAARRPWRWAASTPFVDRKKDAESSRRPSTERLIALGPSILAWGRLATATAGAWTISLGRRFLLGDELTVGEFVDQFDDLASSNRYVIIESFEGRMLAEAPSVKFEDGVVVLDVRVQRPLARQDTNTLIDDMWDHDAKDLDLDGRIEPRQGADAVESYLWRILNTSETLGEGFGGTRVPELVDLLGVVHVASLVNVELIRLATVPDDALVRPGFARFGYIERVLDVIAEPTQDPRIAVVCIKLRLHGVKKPWECVIDFSLEFRTREEVGRLLHQLTAQALMLSLKP